VKDLGCGAGDVAFAAADLVGPDGFVVGVDRSPGGLARAANASANVRDCHGRCQQHPPQSA